MDKYYLQRLSKIDWDFDKQRSSSPFSSMHFHPCRYMSQIPAAFIGALTKPGELVLDPFNGSGTTSVEGQRLGRRTVGFDINPISVLITQAKTIAKPAKYIVGLCDEIELGMKKCLNDSIDPAYKPPASVQLQKWYNTAVSRDLRKIWKYLHFLDGDSKLIANFAFSSILLSVCRETRHWGYVCDNTQPKGDYGSDVKAAFTSALSDVRKAYQSRDAYLANYFGKKVYEATKVYNVDARELASKVKKNTVDLILTSPPYPGVADYVKSQRLSMEWFNEQIDAYRTSEIGARSKRHRRTFSDEYLSDMKTVFQECRYVLKKGKPLVIVYGESSSRKSVVDQLIEDIKDCGFELADKFTRQIALSRRQYPSLHEEIILIFI